MSLILSRRVRTPRSKVALAALRLVTVLVSALLGLGLVPAAARGLPGADGAGPGTLYGVSLTTATRDTGRDQVVDEARGRIYVPIDRGRGKPGSITWIDTVTGERSDVDIDLKAAEPHSMALSEDGSQLFVVHYRASTMSVIDLSTGSLVKEITGTPRFPGGITVDTDTGDVYVYDSKSLLLIDINAGTVSEPISVSTEAYPSIKDAVYDSTNRFIWIAEGRGNLVTGYSTVTKQWASSVAISIGDFKYDGKLLGGRVSRLAIDEKLGHLYASVDPVRKDAWKDSKVVTLDLKTGKHLGSPISVGQRNTALRVNPRTHEVYSLDGSDNTITVIDPASWLVKNTVDFTAAGVTTGTGVAHGDVGSLVVFGDGNRMSVTHPYKRPRVSFVERNGGVSTPTKRDPAPGQDKPVVEETPKNPVWDGPAAPETGAAATSTDATLTWSINEYMKAWSSDALGSVAKQGYDYRFANGRVAHDAAADVTTIRWKDGLRIRHYPGLAPDVVTTLGNPELTVDGSGRGKLTFDVAWSVQPTVRSEGYRRVSLATFTSVKKTVTGQQVRLEVSPEFVGRTFDAGDKIAPNSYPHDFVKWMNEGMRAWWFTTGASMDTKKVPNPFTVTFTNPVKPVPVGPVPVGPVPVGPVPVGPVPVKPVPVKPVPAKPEPARGPVKPAKPAPVKPAKPAPVKPAKPAPARPVLVKPATGGYTVPGRAAEAPAYAQRPSAGIAEQPQLVEAPPAPSPQAAEPTRPAVVETPSQQAAPTPITRTPAAAANNKPAAGASGNGPAPWLIGVGALLAGAGAGFAIWRLRR